MRRLIAALALPATFALLLAVAVPAAADPGDTSTAGDPPGFNGTIKVHAGDSEDEPIRANEPHVGCAFHIHGFGFDSSATGTWRIVTWPPTGDQSTVRWSGSWSADSGTWRTGLLTATSADMTDGRAHFKVFADQNGAPGGEKHKVFWVECGATTTLQPSSSPSPSPSPSPTATPTPTPSATPTTSPVVGGVQQPPTGGISPIVETPGGAQGPIVGGIAQPPTAPASGAALTQPEEAARTGQVAGLSGLPNTSTSGPGLASALLFLVLAIGMRRMR